jgi:hypothetical protein
MVFKEDDDGPFWISKEEKENTRHQKIIQGKSKTRTLRNEELKKRQKDFQQQKELRKT